MISQAENKKNLWRLCFGQFCAYIHAPSMIFIIPIIGYDLAPDTKLSTLALSIYTLTIVICISLANKFMSYFGRQMGYVLAAFLIFISCLGCALAIYYANFFFLCFAVMISGIGFAFVHSYRFAILEIAQIDKSAKWVSYMLLGGVAGGFSGPLIVNSFSHSLTDTLFVGSFIALSIVALINAFVLSGLKFKNLTQKISEIKAPFRINKKFIACAICGASSYGLMSLLMSATPIEMHHHYGYSLGITGWVIQSHVVSMFLPSLFTGFLIDKFGSVKVMLAGAIMFVICCIFALLGGQVLDFWLALVFLGLGWNFLFIGSTIAVSKTYNSKQKFKAQSINDTIVFSAQALGSFGSAWLIGSIGWQMTNSLSLIAIIMIVPFIFLSKIKNQAQMLN